MVRVDYRLRRVVDALTFFALVRTFAGALPAPTNSINFEAISSRGRTKSTSPVLIDVSGMLKSCELGRSWAMTTPPLSFTICTPKEPSPSPPVSTTAMARCRYTSATEANNGSAEGRA